MVLKYAELTRTGPTQETRGQSIAQKLKLTFKLNMHRATRRQVFNLLIKLRFTMNYQQ